MLFFFARDEVGEIGLWTSDGISAAKVPLDTEIKPQQAISPASANGLAYFCAAEGNDPCALWRSDGTKLGTLPLRSTLSEPRDPTHLTGVNGLLFFSADDRISGSNRELWKTDGTDSTLVANINPSFPGGSSNPDELTDVDRRVFFSANDNSFGSGHGRELWVHDGTKTRLVRDIVQGTASSNPGTLTNVGGDLFFAATDSSGDRELWKSDGTLEGTLRVKNISAGVDSRSSFLTDIDGMAFFRADNGIHGMELWRSDGSAAGTQMIQDIRAGAVGSVSDCNESTCAIVASGGGIFFSADDGLHGRELWAIPFRPTPTMLAPNPESVLTGSAATFFWTDPGAGVSEWWLYVGSIPGGKDIYDSRSLGSSSSVTVTGLPTDGRQLYVTLWFRINGLWPPGRGFEYTAATIVAGTPEITRPVPDSTLSSSMETFEWTANGAAVTEWWLYVGSNSRWNDIYDSRLMGRNSLSVAVSALPTDGRKLYVTLWFKGNGPWEARDFQYTAATIAAGIPGISRPVPGSTLRGSTETFEWTANGTVVTEWWLYIGSIQGARDLHDSNTLATRLSTAVTGLPRNGGVVYVRLWYRVLGLWHFSDFTYRAAS